MTVRSSKQNRRLFSQLGIETKRFVPRKRIVPETGKVYSVSDSGLEHFEHVQSKLDQMWKLVKDTSLESSILPYAQSSFWWLPGHGHAKPDCGKIKAKKCDNVSQHPDGKSFGRYYKKTCLAKDCPVCAEAWSARNAEHGVLRITTFLKGAEWVDGAIAEARLQTAGLPRKEFHKTLINFLEHGIKHDSVPVVHWVASPGRDVMATKENFAGLRKEAYRELQKAGALGGTVEPHPYRLRCRKCDVAIPEYAENCPRCGGHNFRWMPSLHFHFAGFSRFKGGRAEDTSEIYDQDGWVVRNFGVRKSVFWTLQYLLSHAGVFRDAENGFKQKKFNVSTWIGELSFGKKLDVPKIIEERELCPLCGAILMQMEDSELGDHPPPVDWEERQDFLFGG